MNYETPHKKYLQYADAVVGLRGKTVLEVGGCSPPDIVVAYAPVSWTCINLDTHAVTNFNQVAQTLGVPHYVAYNQDITNLEQDKKYDLIYSINSFEHIHDFDRAFEKMYEALNPGGRLFSLFGPIWSSDVGHHLSVTSDKGEELHFFDEILAPWEHLTSTPEALQSKLEALYDRPTAQRAVEYIYRYHDLNRLFEHEYMEIIRNSNFEPVLILRRKSGTPPKVPGATSTRELLIVLKKGYVPIWEKVLSLMKFAWTYIRYR